MLLKVIALYKDFQGWYTGLNKTFRWRHNGRDGVSNHQSHDCLRNRLITQAWIKEYIKTPRHWPLWGKFTGDQWTRRTSNAENVYIWWCHHGLCVCDRVGFSGKGGGSSCCIPGISLLDIVYSTSLTGACSEMEKLRKYTTVTTLIPAGDWYKSYYGLGAYLSQTCWSPLETHNHEIIHSEFCILIQIYRYFGIHLLS